MEKLSNTDKARTRIEEYDQELLEDIERLMKHISKQEEIAKEFMRSYGAPEKTVKEVVQKARNDSRPISIDGSSEDIFRIRTFLTEMVPVYKAFTFRAWIPRDIYQPRGTNIITQGNWQVFNTYPLNDEERREYAKQWEATRKQNYSVDPLPLYRGYPNIEFMKIIEKMLMTYETGEVLLKDYYHDEKMVPIWKELWSK